MSRSSRVAESVLIATLLATAAGRHAIPEVRFDPQGRITLPATAMHPVGEPEGNGEPPHDPPNLQCSCAVP